MVNLLDRVFTIDFARQLDTFEVDAQLQQRLDALAEKSTEGELSPDERAEYEEYVNTLDLISILKPQARSFLERNG